MDPAFDRFKRSGVYAKMVAEDRTEALKHRRNVAEQLATAEADMSAIRAALKASEAAQAEVRKAEEALTAARANAATKEMHRVSLESQRGGRIRTLQVDLEETADPRIKATLAWFRDTFETIRRAAFVPGTPETMVKLRELVAQVEAMRYQALEDVPGALENVRKATMTALRGIDVRIAWPDFTDDEAYA